MEQSRTEPVEMKAKKLILVVVVCFLLFWMFQDPTGMAGTSESLASNVWTLTVDFFTAILDFVRALG